MAKIDDDIAKIEKRIEAYKGVSGKEKIVETLTAKLNDLKEKRGDAGKAEPKPSDSDCPEAITDALKSIEEALKLMESGAGVDEKKVREILEKTKIDKNQLGADVLAMIESTRRLELLPLKDIVVEVEDNLSKIFWIALSDLQSGNNVYLYGGAGTGKTFTSKQLAKCLNCTLITINCNQYTSPLEIIGGQTIDGYQEGKLITAWANLTESAEGVTGGMEEGTTGCLLLLDELPKIDPNTAGLLNDALSEVKNPPHKAKIQNARGETFERKRFFCIATGNAKFNEESVDYVANFRQDLSLQDRFAGSTYEVFVDLNVERGLMLGYLFIFNFMSTVRNIIVSNEGVQKGLPSKAFVSIRIMQSLRDTWRYWYENHKKEKQVKTLEEGIESFFGLFTKQQREWLIETSEYSKFKPVIEQMKGEKLGTDTAEQTKEANEIVRKWERETKDKL